MLAGTDRTKMRLWCRQKQRMVGHCQSVSSHTHTLVGGTVLEIFIGEGLFNLKVNRIFMCSIHHKFYSSVWPSYGAVLSKSVTYSCGLEYFINTSSHVSKGPSLKSIILAAFKYINHSCLFQLLKFIHDF